MWFDVSETEVMTSLRRLMHVILFLFFVLVTSAIAVDSKFN